ncbi:MAG: TlpA disulfide reductase family protein [Bacteroidota bacterium]
MKFLLKILVIAGVICSAQLLKAQSDELTPMEMHELHEVLKHNKDMFWIEFDKHIQNGGYIYAFKKDWSEKLNILAGKIASEKVLKERQKLLFEYLQLVTLNAESFDTNIVKRAFKEVPASWKAWGIENSPDVTRLIYTLNDAVGIEKYAEEIGTNIYDELPKVLYNIALQAEIHSDSLKVLKLIDRFDKEFPESYYTKRIKSEFNYSPFKKIKNGNKIPQFTFENTDNSAEIISDENLRGKFYLIDFWGTWCKPCLAEMPYLHEAFKSFKSRNFTIVSISMEDTKGFRAGKWAMPWNNVLLSGGTNSEIAQTFEVFIWPRTILVNPDGIIIATDLELRGKELEKTLARFIKN